MTPQLFLLILRARYKVALFTLLLTVGMTLAVSLQLTKQYTASTAVVIDVKSPDPVAGMVLPGLIAPSYMATQLDIINSDRVAQRVVKLMRLETSPGVRDDWLLETKGKGELKNWLAELLRKKLDAKPSKESNVINIAFTGTEPAFAAAIANAFAQAYIDVNIELKVEPARQYASWFEEQTKTLRDTLEKAQSALTEYQQKNQVLAIDELKVDYEKGKLTELSQALTIVQAQTSDSSSKRRSGKESETITDVMQSPVVMNLKTDIGRLEAKLQDSNVNLGKNHPQTLRTESELAGLKQKLAEEVRQITTSVDTAYQVGRQKERELLAAIEAQKQRVIALNKQRDEINVLKRDVESAQRSYEAVSARSTQTRLESQSLQTNISILAVATEPPVPSRPRIAVNVATSIVIGALLGMGFALLLEFANRRIRSAEDLAAATELPVLAAIAAVKITLPRRSFFRRGGRRTSTSTA